MGLAKDLEVVECLPNLTKSVSPQKDLPAIPSSSENSSCQLYLPEPCLN